MSEARDAAVIEESQRQAARLSRLGWYHSIELPDGSVIEGHQSIEQQRKRIRQFPIPDDLRGKRVLDIGAWDGWFSFEMERRGAEVLAIDSAKNTRLLEARALLGSKIDYRIADICRLTAGDVGTFDIVLFLGVLYHLKHPLLALENVCGMCRDMACVESFVADANLQAVPAMEFYETTELRGQVDNWVGPNASCLMAFCRTAGFARVQFESALGERAHVTAWRHWTQPAGTGPAPHIHCIENSTTHDHDFSSGADDYVSLYFLSEAGDLTADNVYPEIGGFGSRPVYVARVGEGWQANCKLPPGLEPGWHSVSLRVAASKPSLPIRIGVDVTYEDRRRPNALLHPAVYLTRVADGKSFEPNRVRAGDNSAISVWAAGLDPAVAAQDISVRLNGSDLPAIWIARAEGNQPRQINALLPSGIAAGEARVALAVGNMETESVEIELHRN